MKYYQDKKDISSILHERFYRTSVNKYLQPAIESYTEFSIYAILSSKLFWKLHKFNLYHPLHDLKI